MLFSYPNKASISSWLLEPDGVGGSSAFGFAAFAAGLAAAFGAGAFFRGAAFFVFAAGVGLFGAALGLVGSVLGFPPSSIDSILIDAFPFQGRAAKQGPIFVHGHVFFIFCRSGNFIIGNAQKATQFVNAPFDIGERLHNF